MKNINYFIQEKLKINSKTDIYHKKCDRIDEVTLKEFINWYNGDEITKVTNDLLEDMGWDFLAEYLDISLNELTKLMNKNLNNKFKFYQTDLKNCISINWTMEGKDFEVDSITFYGEDPNSR